MHPHYSRALKLYISTLQLPPDPVASHPAFRAAERLEEDCKSVCAKIPTTNRRALKLYISTLQLPPDPVANHSAFRDTDKVGKDCEPACVKIPTTATAKLYKLAAARLKVLRRRREAGVL
jgi:hypothetical protein